MMANGTELARRNPRPATLAHFGLTARESLSPPPSTLAMSAAESLNRPERRPWVKVEGGRGFWSEPDGADHPDCYAEIWFVPMAYAQGMDWAWSVLWGRARRAGHARSSQEAADHCASGQPLRPKGSAWRRPTATPTS